MDIAGIKDKGTFGKLLKDVNLDEEKANCCIYKLSEFEQKCAAIARAVSYDPDIILADDSTFTFDSSDQKRIINIFKNWQITENV